MRIALFTETYLPYINGVVTHVKSLKEGLEKQGHEVLVVTADPHTNHHYLKDKVLHCPAKSIKRFYNFGMAFPFSHTRLQYLRAFDPDIIHIHQEFGIGYSGMQIAKILKKPLVYTLHTMYDDYLYYVAPRPLIPLVKKFSHRYAHFLADSAVCLTGPSKKVEEYFRECGIDKDVSVIPNPVELDTFDPAGVSEAEIAACRAKYGLAVTDTVACFCGRLGQEKSVDILLDYWKKAVSPKDGCKLMIIGDGPARPALEEQAAALGIADQVIFTGAIRHNDLPPYYACCDLYITASLSDTNSISMLEGMASGLPVLQRNDPLNEGQVENGINGYIFGTPAEMRTDILKIRDLAPEEKKAFRRKVRNSVKTSGCEALANYILAVYRQSQQAEPKQRHPAIQRVKARVKSLKR